MPEDWVVEGVNYWENENCPHDILVKAFIELADFVEGAEIDENEAKSMTREELVKKISFYEHVADK